MAATESSWVMVLQCSQCSEKFTVAGLWTRDIADTPNATPCPVCGHNPGARLVSPFSRRHHLVISLKNEKTN
jgi:hypothetical protein